MIMNIFFLDENPSLSAQYHCDKHVVKMILETSQLLCSVHHVCGEVEPPYKLAHKNHPCSVWTRSSLTNYIYLCELGLELSKEYTYRYGKFHKSTDVIRWCLLNLPPIKDIGFTKPPLAMPDEYKVDDYVLSYRNYYIGAKSGFTTWKNRDIPEWFLTHK
jgi:hypothetical protein